MNYSIEDLQLLPYPQRSWLNKHQLEQRWKLELAEIVPPQAHLDKITTDAKSSTLDAMLKVLDQQGYGDQVPCSYRDWHNCGLHRTTESIITMNCRASISLNGDIVFPMYLILFIHEKLRIRTIQDQPYSLWQDKFRRILGIDLS